MQLSPVFSQHSMLRIFRLKPLICLTFNQGERERRSILAISLLKINQSVRPSQARSGTSALTLLVAGIRVAYNPNHAIAPDNLAVPADFFYRCTYFHFYFS
jgi:hypothetical protein